ncbi:MAG: alpha/beta hydrolase, partial [Rubricella sp.]
MSGVERFEPGDGRSIAYHKVTARGEGVNLPGVVFLGGFRSDMAGTKAQYLHEWAVAAGRDFLRFDYTGHGESSGDFLDGCIGDWARDAADAILALTDGPQVLVGSSMGGWISLLLARAHPGRVAGIVGIAAAPDFTERGMWAGFTEAERKALVETGRVEQPSDYSDEPYVLTRRLIEDGRENLVFDKPLPLPFPVRLLHGTADA